MKKHFFALMVGGAICGTSPVFAMDKEENITSNSIPVNLNPRVEEKKVITTGIPSYDGMDVRGTTRASRREEMFQRIFLDINCTDYEKYILNLQTDTILNGEHVYRKID